MTSATCLPRDTLKQYLIGDMADSQSVVIEAHLATCEACEQTVVALEADPDTLLVGVRGLAEVTPAPDSPDDEASVIKHAVAAARQLSDPVKKPVFSWPVGQIGAYELLRPLGRGGMGMVVLARHRSLQKEVAIKLLSSLVGDKPDLVSRFQREMRAAGRLQHPAIVNATDAGQEQGIHYLVMEYIAGLDLSRISRLTGRLAIADACELMRQTALGLSHAHAEGIVHRDVKPSNLMLDATGRVKILDFGLAQMSLWEEPACELTTVGQLMGTIDYMAPEQAERTGAVDYRADLYALGATLFRLLAGRAPLAAAPNMTLLEKVRLLGSQTSPLLSSIREDCPDALVQLVSQLLSRDPASRPASAAHVAEALQPFCEGSQLVELLESAQAAAVAEHATDAVDHSMRLQSGLAQPALKFTEANVGSQPPARPPRGRGLWIAAAAIPLMILAGFLITIETQKGQLVIQSDVADVQIKVARDGTVVDEFSVHPGAQATRLRADKYEILIDAPSDQVVIDKQQFSVKNGETVVATIKRVQRSALSDAATSGLDSPKINSTGNSHEAAVASVKLDEPTYKLVGYREWLRILATDTSEEKQTEALNALSAISTKHSIVDARPVIVEVVRACSKVSNHQLGTIGLNTLWRTFSEPSEFYQFLADELRTGGAEWQIFLLKSPNTLYQNGEALPVIREAMQIVTKNEKAKTQVVQESAIYLCNFLRGTQNDSATADIQREVAGVLAKANFPPDFWYRWNRALELQEGGVLADLIAGAAMKVVSNEKSTPEQMLRALRVLTLYNKPLPEVTWIERLCKYFSK